MGRKKGLAAIFSKPNKLSDDGSSPPPPSPPWPWPSCANTPQTASFRHHGRGDHDDQPCATRADDYRRRSVASVGAAGSMLLLPRRTAAAREDVMYKTVNSVYYFDPDDEPADSCFAFDDDSDALALGEDNDCVSYSTTTASEEWSEAVIRSLGCRTSTDRFFFDSGPPPASNSILAASPSPSPSPGRTVLSHPPSPGRGTTTTLLQHTSEPSRAPAAAEVMPEEGDSDYDSDHEQEDPTPSTTSLVEESVAVALDSDDPYGDFRASMDEMVAAHGLRDDWPALQEMLLWYLRINAKHNHAVIIAAFVDLLVSLGLGASRSGAATTTTTMTMTATTATATSSSCSSTSGSVAGGATGCCTSGAATTTVDEHCRRRGESSGTTCFPAAASSSSDQEEEEEEAEPQLVRRRRPATMMS